MNERAPRSDRGRLADPRAQAALIRRTLSVARGVDEGHGDPELLEDLMDDAFARLPEAQWERLTKRLAARRWETDAGRGEEETRRR
jgi:hypothetical protein